MVTQNVKELLLGHLAATWTIYGPSGSKLLVTKKPTFLVLVESSSYDGIVMAESRAVEDLSREIAQAFNSYLKEMPPD